MIYHGGAIRCPYKQNDKHKTAITIKQGIQLASTLGTLFKAQDPDHVNLVMIQAGFFSARDVLKAWLKDSCIRICHSSGATSTVYLKHYRSKQAYIQLNEK